MLISNFTKLRTNVTLNRLLLVVLVLFLYGTSNSQCPLPTDPVILDQRCVIFQLGSSQFTSIGQGFLGPSDCFGAGVAEYSVNGGAFSPTLPAYSQGLTIDSRCNCSPGPLSGSGSTVMTNSDPSCLLIPLTFFDPCDCTNPLNCNINGVQYNADILTLDMSSIPLFAVGSTVTIVSASNDFISTSPCTTGGTVFPHTAGNAFTETSPGVFELPFWKTYNGSLPNVVVQIDPPGQPAPFNVPVPESTFSTHISPACDCNTQPTSIPTMSQWGLIIFGLLVMNLSLFFLYRREQIFNVAGVGTLSVGYAVSPFDKFITIKYFLCNLLGLTVLFTIAILLFGYALMPFDIPGSILTAGLLAYLIQLIQPKSYIE